MNYVNLRKQIITLANLPQGDVPLISAYFNLQQPLAALEQEFLAWAQSTEKTFQGETREGFHTSVDRIRDWLRTAEGPSAAVFSRQGEHPFFKTMNFQVALESYFHVGEVPAIFPLVELKDRFNRFVVVLTTQNLARIIEVNLGETSLEILAKRPAIRERSGREWTREHYLSHSADRDRKFVKEKVEIIEELMAKRGHNALIIAGEPRFVARLQEALPANLQSKVIDQIRTGIADERLQEVLQESIQRYLVAEGEESDNSVKTLIRALRTNGLVTFGVESTQNALSIGQADQLVISSKLNVKDRENLVRLASQSGTAIETVRDSEVLEAQGGVGALLRYRSHYRGPQPVQDIDLMAS